MTFRFKTALAIGATLAMTLSASAESVGTVVVNSSDVGSVIVVRGGSTYSLSSGDQLFDGDRVISRTDGSATITVNGCQKTLEEASSIIIDSAFCDIAPVDFIEASPPAPGLEVAGDAGAGRGGRGVGGGPGAGGGNGLAILAGLGIAGGVAALAGGGGGDDDDTPTSP